MLEHFSQGNAMALCTKVKDISKILSQYSHEDFEDVRHLLSFRKLVESSPPKQRIALLTDDTFLKNSLHIELVKLHQYLYTFHFFLKCLHVMVADLPKYPLGKQVCITKPVACNVIEHLFQLREIYALAVSKDISHMQEYRECFQLLSFQSKDELSKKIAAIEALLLTEMRKKSNDHKEILQQFYTELAVYINNLRVVDKDNGNEEMELEEQNENLFSDCRDRNKLKNVTFNTLLSCLQITIFIAETT